MRGAENQQWIGCGAREVVHQFQAVHERVHRDSERRGGCLGAVAVVQECGQRFSQPRIPLGMGDQDKAVR
jgi:hypothetical protein